MRLGDYGFIVVDSADKRQNLSSGIFEGVPSPMELRYHGSTFMKIYESNDSFKFVGLGKTTFLDKNRYYEQVGRTAAIVKHVLSLMTHSISGSELHERFRDFVKDYLAIEEHKKRAEKEAC